MLRSFLEEQPELSRVGRRTTSLETRHVRHRTAHQRTMPDAGDCVPICCLSLALHHLDLKIKKFNIIKIIFNIFTHQGIHTLLSRFHNALYLLKICRWQKQQKSAIVPSFILNNKHQDNSIFMTEDLQVCSPSLSRRTIDSSCGSVVKYP